MSSDLDHQAMAAHLAATAQRDRDADEHMRQHREARRALVLARYGSATAALAPCERETALRDATWGHVVPGTSESGPSLLGWRDGPASSLPREVLRDVSTAIRAPGAGAEAWEEYGHWAHRAEVRALLGAPVPPPWVRARWAFLEVRLDTLFTFLPGDAAALAEWRRCEAKFDREQAAREGRYWPAGEDPDTGRAPIEPAEMEHGKESGAVDISPGQGDQTGAVQSEQPARTRAEAREAVRALLAEGLTDREIARRIGVSPSTVGAVRKAMGSHSQEAANL